MGGKLSRDIQALNGKRPRKRKQHRTPESPIPDGPTSPHHAPPSLESDTSSKPESKSSKTVISGRDFHATQTSSYWLPKDEEEQDRLVGQHFAIKEVNGGLNYLPSVGKHIPFDTAGTRVLDIGCGSGAWIMDMAVDHPSCEYVGVDMVDVAKAHIVPDNIKFLYSDLTEGLPEIPSNTYDFVHMRLFVLALREDEWQDAVHHAVRVAKPGGVVQLLEYYFTPTFDHDPTVGKAANAIVDTMATRGQDPYVGPKLGKLLTKAGCHVLETDKRPIDMTTNTMAARKFIWNWQQVLKGMMPIMGPNIGLTDKDEQNRFIQDVCHGISHCPPFFFMYAAAGQKL